MASDRLSRPEQHGATEFPKPLGFCQISSLP